MINVTRRSPPRPASAQLLIPALTLVLTGLFSPYASAGTLTLISTPIGGYGERKCTLSIPAAGAGKTVMLSLSDKGGAGVGNCYDMQPSEIIMEDIPSAAEILLTDDWWCDTTLDSNSYKYDDPEDNKNFYIKLVTTRNPSKLPEIGIDQLLRFKKGETIYYQNEEGNKPIGFKMADNTFNDSGRVTRKLSCVKVTISEGEHIPELKTVELGETTTINRPNEEKSDVLCPSGSAITGRKHKGDEKGSTDTHCTVIKGNGTDTILMQQSFKSSSFPECGRRKPNDEDSEPHDKDCHEAVTYHKDKVDPIYFTCPTDSILIGRDHQGDENGLTNYTCAEFYINEIDEDKVNRLIVEPGPWAEESVKESDSDFKCASDEVMIGRAHKSDENGDTVYRCAKLYYPTHTKGQVTP